MSDPSGASPQYDKRVVAAPIALRPLYFSPDEPAATPQKSLPTFPILIVEDDFLIAFDLETALVDSGFTVVGIAATAEEALALATSHAPSLVLMDIRLAGKRDGIDAALELFRVHGIRCVFASAHSDDDARRRAAPARPLGWVEKPYSIGAVVELIGQLCDARK
jgi:DNA-binding NarL/FixJ family response regulator